MSTFKKLSESKVIRSCHTRLYRPRVIYFSFIEIGACMKIEKIGGAR
jgi:hypothetical protein